jgi:hypothetical protein
LSEATSCTIQPHTIGLQAPPHLHTY